MRGYAKGDHHFEELCRRGDLDLVYIATPWNWHVPMAVAALEGGAHAGVEVPAAVTLEECWRLVDTSERTRRHCMILENCCYGWSERLVLNLVRAGMLGEIIHAECGYIHDLRSLLFQNRGEGPGTKGTFADYPPRIFFDGQKGEEWQELHQGEGRPPGGIEDRFEDRLWKAVAKPGRGGDGGMDYLMSYRLVQCLREGLAPELDVYDAAAWSAPAALSEQSVAGGSAPVDFPDFTRGRWREGRAGGAAAPTLL